ncbi:MAG: type II toxin-antitoxin system VapC family toxin [Rhodanobacteraceae bacterium]|nr:MAG: type II toxin-antitoxin system VapC family toxin [Rhodanobacteraceae bacterium]
MSYLLDTHAFLWAVMQPGQLSPRARKLLENPASDIVVSAATAWEIATKFRLGKLPSAAPIVADIDDVARRLGARWLPISHAHAMKAGGFPQPHGDPFDRMLAAQAQIERWPLVSRDRALRQFGVELLW